MEYEITNNIKIERNYDEASYGTCRCCLEEGNHRDITTVYVDSGAKEVYADIFLDCFNVFLSTNTNLSTLICSMCVTLLRQARDFKALVMRTEERLTEELQKCNDEQMVLVNVPVKNDTFYTTVGFQIQVNNLDTMKQTVKETHKIKVETTQEYPDSSLDTSAIESNDTNTSEEESLQKFIDSERDPHKRALILNTYQLLASSNSTLFKNKTCTGFPCFYCRQTFEEFDCLKQHQNEQHVKTDLLKALKPYSAESLVVYADIDDLKCTICDSAMPNLKELKSHLINTHEMKFRKNITDRVVPFKVLENSYECQICSAQFENFGSIVKHMNTHIRNYVCDVCGSGFVTMMRLKNHIYTRHREGIFLCEYCDKVFNTRSKLKVHIDFVHKMLKKLRCNKCPERFSDYFVQKKHMVDVHGEQPVVYRCNVCSKGFRRRYTLSYHMKRHLNQKDFSCDVCQYTCYSNTELKLHKLKHNRINFRKFANCSICDKAFKWKKSLKAHMKIHYEEDLHMCNICDTCFVSGTTLKNHKETHHCSGDFVSHGCDLCDATFEDNNDLNAHMKNHHSDMLCA